MRQLSNFVEAKRVVPPDEDNVYVAGFERSPPDQKDEKFFRLFYTTDRLLRSSTNAKIIHADGTHEVTLEKIPLLVMGSSDADGQFHLIGLCLTTHENLRSNV